MSRTPPSDDDAAAKIARLDETVVIQELLLQSLTKRKELLIKQRQGFSQKLEQHVQELTAMQKKEAMLQQSMKQHVDLKLELENKVRKSEEVLRRNNIMEQQSTSTTTTTTLQEQAEQRGGQEQAENRSSSSLHTQEVILIDHSDESSHESIVTASNPHHAVPIQTLALSDKKHAMHLLKATFNSSFLGFYRVMDSTRLERWIDFVVANTVSNAQVRREALFHTCLLPYKWDMKDKEDSTNSDATVPEELDPNTSLCPYELTGICADPYCTFQHLEERREISQAALEKELLPLPALRLTEPPSKRRKISSKTTTHHQEEESVVQRASNNSSEKDQTASLDFNEDFLSLPPAVNEDEGNDDNSIDSTQHSQGPRLWWMNDEDRERVDHHWRDCVIPLSLQDYLFIVFQIEIKDSILSYCTTVDNNHSDMDSIALAGRLLDALKIMIHGGRLDLAQAVLNIPLFQKAVRSQSLEIWLAHRLACWTPNNHHRNLFQTSMEQQMVLSCLSHLMYLRHKFQNNRDPEKARMELLSCITTLPGLSNEPHPKLALVFIKTYKSNESQEMKEMCSLANLCVMIQKLYASPMGTDLKDLNEQLNKLDQYQRNATQTLDDPLEKLWTVLQVGIVSSKLVQALAQVETTQRHAARLDSKLDNVYSWMYDQYESDLHPVMTPILALRISIMVSLRRYDRAQRTLETNLAKDRSVCSFSDLLWSQLVTLKSNLPSNNTTGLAISRPLSNAIRRVGAKLNFLTLPGDRSLFHPFNASSPAQKKQLWRKRLQPGISIFVGRLSTLADDDDNGFLLDLTLESLPLALPQRYPGKLISLSGLAFPQSLMYGGLFLRTLNLTDCGIDELPTNFGNYFPNLRELLIRSSELVKLPSSIGNLSSLVKLDASDNQLLCLPEEMGQCTGLEELILANNQLTMLPKNIVLCSSLRRVDLSHNCFESMPQLALHIDSLYEMNMSNNPCCVRS